MSDVSRVYTGNRRALQSRRRPRRSSTSGCGKFLLLIVLALVLYGAWVTRDTYPVSRFIPGDQKYAVVVPDLLAQREAVAQSRVWDALAGFGIDMPLQDALALELTMSPLMLRNLFPAECYISGADVARFSDPLLVSHMTRFGCLLEKMSRLKGGAEYDRAGGLRLRRMKELNVYYAVRGRVLLVSPSREALIHALTLTPENTADPGDFASLTGDKTGGTVRGQVLLEPDAPRGDVLRSVAFDLGLTQTEARVGFRATLTADWEGRLAPLLESTAPKALAAPPNGLAAVSLDFDKPVKDVWLGLGPACPDTFFSEEQWAEWEELPADGRPELAALLTRIVGGLGPDARLAWRGFDLQAMFPAPELAGVFGDGGMSYAEAQTLLPAPPDGIEPWESFPRFDDEQQSVHLQLFGGPAFEPSVVWHEGLAAVANRRTSAQALTTEAAPALPEPANLYIRLNPSACVEALAQAGNVLAGVDALRGHTQASFDAMMDEWRAKTAALTEVAASFAWEDGEITGKLNLLCNK